MAFGQLRAPISGIRSNSYAGLGGQVLRDPTGERRKRQFRQRFRGLQSCQPNSFGESGLKYAQAIKAGRDPSRIRLPSDNHFIVSTAAFSFPEEYVNLLR